MSIHTFKEPRNGTKPWPVRDRPNTVLGIRSYHTEPNIKRMWRSGTSNPITVASPFNIPWWSATFTDFSNGRYVKDVQIH